MNPMLSTILATTGAGDAIRPDDVNLAVMVTVATTGFAVAFLHAAIPTHWLPFVLVARARSWSCSKMLAVTAAAGLGHVALTTVLGLVIAWLGFQIGERVGALFPWIAGGLLWAVAGYFFWRQWRGSGICHHHPPGNRHRPTEECGHEPDHTHWDDELKESKLVSPRDGDWAAIGGLFMMLTLSPCEGFLPIYLAGVQWGWSGFFVLSAILACGTLGAMTLLTWLAHLGLEHIEIKRFEHYEALMLGVLFTILGAIIVVLEQ
jgi:nickel/cobalt transporter (NicO) family protein